MARRTVRRQSSAQNVKKRDKQSPYGLFAERVNITGLFEAYHNHFLSDRIMFQITVIVAILAMMYETYVIVTHFKRQDTVFLDFVQTGGTVPFPNVTVCFPIFMNGTVLQQFMVVPPRAMRLMEKYNVGSIDFLDVMDEVNKVGSTVSHYKYTILRTIYDATVDSMIEKGVSPQELIQTPCPSIFSNCIADELSFDCCQNAKFFGNFLLNCYQIRPTFHHPATQHLSDTTLTFNASIDWTFPAYDTSMTSDGFHVYIDRPPHTHNIPIHVPSGMDVQIALAEPTLMRETGECYPEDKTPKLAHFEYYDSYGTQCQWEPMIAIFKHKIGCIPAMSSFYSVKEACTFAQTTIFAMTLAVADDQGYAPYMTKERMKIDQELKQNYSRCYPICTRWTYHVLSSSYTAIQYPKNIQRPITNRTWSRIKITMPNSYIEHVETTTTLPFLVVRHIGAMMGAYVGVSVITMVQITAYGSYIVWSLIKKKKATARVEPDPETSV